MNCLFILALILGFTKGTTDDNEIEYSPSWSILDNRKLPVWYDEVKIGIFIHWGVYSVPSFGSEWFWIDWKGNPSPNRKEQKRINDFMKKNYRPGYAYQDFASDFTGEFFDADEWISLFEKSGAKYVVFTSKHHDGFAMWPSKYSFGWNSVDIGLHRDVVGELSYATLKKDTMRFGVYHSLYEWFNPLYMLDKANNYSTNFFIKNKVALEIKELVEMYKPEIIWSDGEWEADSDYWKSKEFLAWLYNDSPVASTVVVNDRWGQGTLCKHGGYYTCADRFNPGTLQKHKWENAMSLDKTSWGFNRLSKVEDYMTTKELINTLAETVSCGGNILINVGPTHDGRILPIFQDRLLGLGEWLGINGEAIYNTKPYDTCQNDTNAEGVWYTMSKDGEYLYGIILKWPTTNVLFLACASIGKLSHITMLGVPGKLQVVVTPQQLVRVDLPDKANATSNIAWTIKIAHLMHS